MITGVNDDRVLAQSRVFDVRQDRADALIYESDEPEIKAADFSGPISSCSVLLPFARQPITQWHIFTERDRRAGIDVYLLERVLIVEGAVVRRVRLDK